jgi:glycosyltransferase involved in cell wall biosynthesis
MCRGVALATAGPAAQVFSLRSQQNFDPSLISFSSVYSRAGKEKVSTDKIFSLPVQSTRPVHICYIHHPPRNLYGYATGSDLQQYWVVRAYAAIINFFLRQYDFDSAQAVDYFVANSKETARRVEKFYRRNSVVVYPPIGISNINPSADGQRSKIQTKNQRLKEPKNYFLSVGRLTYAKRVDLAIQACNALKLPLKIVGVGKEEKHLRALALQGTSLHRGAVEFLGGVSDKELQKLYAGAKALIFSALDEDFGMVPVEAMAHGTPVIALAQGGVKETVVDGVTGVLFQEPTAESLEYAVKRFMGMEKEWSQACRNQAKKFSKERFKKEFLKYVNNVYKNTKKRL